MVTKNGPGCSDINRILIGVYSYYYFFNFLMDNKKQLASLINNYLLKIPSCRLTSYYIETIQKN